MVTSSKPLTSRRESWRHVCERLSARDPEGLTAAELDTLADALFWLDRPADSAVTWERAYAAHAAAGDGCGATMAGWRAFFEYFLVGELAVASGWLERLRALGAQRSGSVEVGYHP